LRALVRAYALVDYGAIIGRNGLAERRSALAQFARMAFMMGLMGLSSALVVLATSDRLLSATVVVATTTMWVVLMLMGRVHQLMAPDDYMIVACRPVSSATYFAANVAALGMATIEVAWLTGWPSVAAFGVRGWGDPVLMAAAALSIALTAIATLAAVTTFYGGLMRILPPAVVAQAGAVIAILGLGLTTALVVFAFVQIGESNESSTEGFRLADAGWSAWLPTTWFAAPVLLAGSAGEMRYLGSAAAALGVVGLGMAALLGSIARDYSLRVGAIASRTSGSHRGPGTMTRRLRGDLRAAYLLFRAHLRGDVVFQIGAVMHFVLVALVLLIDTGGELPRDPFITPAQQRPPATFMLAVGWLGLSAFQSLMTSQEHQASWFWFTTPGRRVEQVRALKRLAVGLGVGLPLILIWIYFSYAYGGVLHSLFQTLFAAGIGLMFAQLAIAWKPAVPFSMPLQERHGMFSFVIMVPLGLLSLPLALVLYTYSYRSYANAAVTLALLLAGNLLLRRLTRGLLERRAAQLSYRG
jgi:hypothetical protein